MKNFIRNIILKLDKWALAHPQYVKPIHTAIQTFLAVIIVGLPAIFGFVSKNDYTDAWAALLALIVAALAATLSKLKSQLWPIALGWAKSQLDIV